MNANQKELKKLYSKRTVDLNHVRDNDDYNDKRENELQKMFDRQDQA